jgi:hypothetical protein
MSPDIKELMALPEGDPRSWSRTPLSEWYTEALYAEQGWELVEEDLDGDSYKNNISCCAFLKHTATGRYIQVMWTRSHYEGYEATSFEFFEVTRHEEVVTKTIVSWKPVPKEPAS